MAIPASATPYRLTAIPVLATFALAFGILGAWRLGTTGRLDLLVAIAGSIAAAIAFTQAAAFRYRAGAAMAVVAAAILTVGQSILDIRSPASNGLVWMMLSIGIICWSEDLVGLARLTIISSAGLSLAFPLLFPFGGSSVPGSATQALAAVTAAIALGTALNHSLPALSLHRHTIRGIEPTAIPRMLLWVAVATFSMAATVSDDPAWTVLTILAVAAVLLVESLTLPSSRSNRVLGAPTEVAFAIGLVAIASAAGLAVVSLTVGGPFGWPVAGVALAAFISVATVGTESLRRGTQQVERLKQSALESRIDVLTGLTNRRGFDQRLNDEVARAHRYGHPLSLLMIDIDDFKQVNDRFGHAAGDATLQTLATLIEQSIRSIDIGARYGGEEFVVLLPETHIDGATVVADRICLGMAENSSPVPATVSIGVAELNALDPSPAVLLKQADEALYRAKWQGKNRVELAR